MKEEVRNNFILVFLKILFFCSFYYKFGISLSLFSTFFLDYVYYYFLKIIFGLTPLTGYDKIFITSKQINRVTILWSLEFSNFNIKKMNDFITEKIIKSIGKFRSKLIYNFGEYFWKEFPFNEEIPNKNIIIKENFSKEELNNYLNNEANTPINIFSDYPYKFNIISSNEENKGYLIIKYDHILTDGLGLISTLCLLTDNFDYSIYPTLIQRLKSPKWYQTIYLYIVSVFYMISISISSSLYRIIKSPYKSNIKGNSKNSSFYFGKVFKLKSFENYRKEKKVSFNDIIMTSFSRAVKEELKDNNEYKNKKNIIINLPIGYTVAPKKLSEISLYNQARWVLNDIPLINEKDDVKKISKIIRKFLKPEKLFALGLLSDFQGIFFPINILRKYFESNSKKYDFVFSNIPGPAKKLIYNDMICDDIKLYSTAGWGLPFVLILGYNGNFRSSICSNENCDLNVRKLLDNFDMKIKEYIS